VSEEVNNWIKLNRKMTEWGWYSDSRMVHLFIHLLMKAKYQDTEYRGTPIKRGQLPTGRKVLSAQTNIPESAIFRCLKRLEKSGEITMQANSKWTLITICNYDTYQSVEFSNEQQTNNKRTANEQQTNTTEEGKKVRNKEIKKFVAPTPAEVLDYCNEKSHGWDLNKCEKFVNHYEATGWMRGKTKIKSWKACVTTWVKGDNTSQPSGPSISDAQRQEQKRLDAVEEERIRRQQEMVDRKLGRVSQ